MQHRDFSLVFQYPNDNYTSLDSQYRMLYNDLKHANVGNKIEVYSTWESENIDFQYFFFEFDYFSYRWSKSHKIWYTFS